MHGPTVRDARLGPACGSAVRDDGSDGRAAPLFVVHSLVGTVVHMDASTVRS